MMTISIDEIRERLTGKGLKVTPQRIAILDAICNTDSHPTAENIMSHIRKNNPNIALGTVYKVLDTLVEKNLIRKVNTDNGVMRYDGTLDTHHHIYCSENNTIKDYVDEELDRLLSDYFKTKKIKGFKVSELALQIKGSFM